jgi:hypothetical protein
MPYDSTKDPMRNELWSPTSLGRKGRTVAPHDENDLDPYAKALIVTAAGDLSILPVENDDGDTIDFTALPAGTVIPYRVRRVLDTGTDATVATIDS